MLSLKKKGDVTISTIIWIILGLVVLVMLIIGFTKGFDFFFGLFDKGPSELQQIAKACAVYAQGGLTIDFCAYRLVGDEIVNCRDSRIIASLKTDGVKIDDFKFACTDDGNVKAKEACDTLVSDHNKTRINNAAGELVGCPQ
jgi:hypothetical protein